MMAFELCSGAPPACSQEGAAPFTVCRQSQPSRKEEIEPTASGG